MSKPVKHARGGHDNRTSLCGLWWWRSISDPKRARTVEEVTCQACLRVPGRMRAGMASDAPVEVAPQYARRA